MKIALYARVSTDEQAKTGESIQDQLQALRHWARVNGHTVYREYVDEGYSAHKSYKSRPALGELLKDIGCFDAIVFTKFDRWTRKAADYYKLQDILDAHNVVWKSILEDYDTMTSDGRFKVGIMLSVNQHEAERTSDRIKFTMQQKRSRGEIVSGKMPKGYKLVPKSNEPEKDPELSGAVHAFFNTYLQGRGMKAAMLAANDAGLSLESSTAAFMLKNARSYTGTIQGVPCEPYITDEQADLILSTRRSAPRKTNYVYLFSGLIVCPECGGHFGAHTNYYSHKDGNKVAQIVYNCNHRHRRQPYGCSNFRNINENILEEYLLERLNGILADMVVVAEEREKTRQNDENALKRITRLEKRKERAISAYLDGLMSKERLKSEQEAIEAELAELKAPKKEKSSEQIRATLPKGWREMYDVLPQEGKREFWFRIIEKIEIDKDRNIAVKLRS